MGWCRRTFVHTPKPEQPRPPCAVCGDPSAAAFRRRKRPLCAIHRLEERLERWKRYSQRAKRAQEAGKA